jgi:hypothetical protein
VHPIEGDRLRCPVADGVHGPPVRVEETLGVALEGHGAYFVCRSLRYQRAHDTVFPFPPDP